MKFLKIQYYLEKNLIKPEHRLYVRLGINGVYKKVYSDFLVPEACFIKEENRTIARSNNSKFVGQPRFFSKNIQANKWIEEVTAKADDVNDRIRNGEEFTMQAIHSYLSRQVSQLVVPMESTLLFSDFLKKGYQEHQRQKKVAGKPLASNTKRTYDFYIKKYTSLAGSSLLAIDFNQKVVDRITEELMDDPNWNNTSVRSMFGPIKVMFRVGLEMELLPSAYKVPKIPFIKDSEYQLKTRLTISQIEEIRNHEPNGAMAKEGRDAFLIAYFGCGMRMSEVIGLRMNYFNPQMKVFQYYNKKGKRMSGSYQLADRLWEVVEKYYDSSLPPTTFLLPCMREYSHMVFSPDSDDLDRRVADVRNYFHLVYANISTALGFPENFTTHSARKSFAIHLYEMTGNAFMVKEMLGHAKMETTIIYLSKNGIKMVQQSGETQDIFDKLYEREEKNPIVPFQQKIRKIG